MAPLRIRVNCIAPGAIVSEGWAVYAKEVRERYHANESDAPRRYALGIAEQHCCRRARERVHHGTDAASQRRRKSLGRSLDGRQAHLLRRGIRVWQEPDGP